MARKLKGIAAAPGIAIAPVVHFHTTLDQIPTRQIADEHVAAEKARLVGAIETVTENLTELQKELAGALGKHDVRIYDAQLAILHDKTFIKEVEGEIDERKCNLEVALQRVVARYNPPSSRWRTWRCESAPQTSATSLQLVGALVARGRQITPRTAQTTAADEFCPATLIPDREHIRGIGRRMGATLRPPRAPARDPGHRRRRQRHAGDGNEPSRSSTARRVVLDPSPEELAEYERRLAERGRGVASANSAFTPSSRPMGPRFACRQTRRAQDLALGRRDR